MSVHSFSLRTTNDLLHKARRELDRFDSLLTESSIDIEGQSDHAFNFVVSVWHLTDWAWREFRSDEGKAFGCNSFNDFHSKVRKECDAIQICYELATGAKHFHLKDSKSKAVKSTSTKTTQGGGIVGSIVQPIVRPIVSSITGGYTVHGLVIRLSSGRSAKPIEVFQDAIKYWEVLLDEEET